jgi:hypothetical protein
MEDLRKRKEETQLSSILRKAMLPVAVAIAMVGFIGAFGSGAVPTAEAVEGDICQVDVDSRAVAGTDGQGNPIFTIQEGVTYGLVFRVEDDDNLELAVLDPAGPGEFILEFDGTGENITAIVDSETGSGRITSHAEIVDVEDRLVETPVAGVEGEADVPNIGHFNINPGVIEHETDSFSPRYINDADGDELDSINAWLAQEGYPEFADDDADVCGDDSNVFAIEGFTVTEFLDDSWGFIDFECVEPGFFNVSIESGDETREHGAVTKFRCEGQADTAEIKAQRMTVETDPTNVPPNGFGTSLITVTVFDQFGDRLDGANVTFTTDNCTFTNPEADNPDDSGTDPENGGTTVETFSDTDSDSDLTFLIDNPLNLSAGTAELTLDCTTSAGEPGVANVMAIVEREGAPIVLEVQIKVVGPVDEITLVLDPDEDFDCGEPVKATATLVDEKDQPVSDGTVVNFTTVTATGVTGGVEGAQGSDETEGGVASVILATDPRSSGTHTVAATSGGETAVATYECNGGGAVAGDDDDKDDDKDNGTIKPPSTGDAGLATGTTSATLFVIAGAVAFVLAGLASVRFARN